jgi:hypothetical protein
VSEALCLLTSLPLRFYEDVLAAKLEGAVLMQKAGRVEMIVESFCLMYFRSICTSKFISSRVFSIVTFLCWSFL